MGYYPTDLHSKSKYGFTETARGKRPAVSPHLFVPMV